MERIEGKLRVYRKPNSLVTQALEKKTDNKIRVVHIKEKKKRIRYKD